MFFTLEDYKKIEEYLKLNSKKDTDFVTLPEEKILAEDDMIAVVHKGVNHKITFSTMANVIEKCRTDVLKELIEDLLNQIDSLLISGLALSNHFGDDPHIGISQKTLTEAFNRVWNKLEDITGEVLRGISMKVTPVYFTGNDGCTVHIKAMTVDTTGIFEQIYFYWNNSLEPFAGSDIPTSYFEFDTELMNTAVLKCRAKIMGIWYEELELIVHNDFFWLGAGSSYLSIFNDAHKHSADSCCIRSNYDITCNNGDHIFFIIPDAAARAFQRADMNGIEIAFTQSTFTDENDNVFRVYTSENTYEAGTYNIDING